MQHGLNLESPKAIERHYSPAELGELWGLHPKTIIRLFRDTPGVLKLQRHRLRGKPYVTLRIPESVAKEAHRRLAR